MPNKSSSILPLIIFLNPKKASELLGAYKKVLASDIDVVLLATPPGYRPEHFVAAVEAKKHIFAEKPFGTDPVGVRKVMAAVKKAEQLKLTVMSGAQRRNQAA